MNKNQGHTSLRDEMQDKLRYSREHSERRNKRIRAEVDKSAFRAEWRSNNSQMLQNFVLMAGAIIFFVVVGLLVFSN